MKLFQKSCGLNLVFLLFLKCSGFTPDRPPLGSTMFHEVSCSFFFVLNPQCGIHRDQFPSFHVHHDLTGVCYEGMEV